MTYRRGVSLKDIIKLERLTKDFASQYFPEGKRQVNSTIRELMTMFQFKYSRKQVMAALSYAACCCCIAEYMPVNEEEIILAIRTRIPGTFLSAQEAGQLYACVRNRQVKQISDCERDGAMRVLSRVAIGLMHS